MSTTPWLANAHPETSWHLFTWSDLAAMPADTKSRTFIVLPVHGFADHGLGLPLDAEETVGSCVLKRAIAQTHAAKLPIIVLPPMRFGLAPYPHTRFGIDAETGHAQLCEIARSVKAAGFDKIVFFNTSPWNEELVATVAIDTRVEMGLRNYVINLPKNGLSFHPGATNEARTAAQAAAAYLLGLSPEDVRDNVVKSAMAEVSDTEFRPGNFQQPEVLVPDETLDGETILNTAATQLSHLLCELVGYTGAIEVVAQSTRAPLFPQAYRNFYLPALTASEIDSIPDKDRALVIIPTGAIEEHGPHMPVGVDAILGQMWLAHALPKLSADAASRVFVAPPITYGKSIEHVGYPGTITITAKTLRRTLLTLATELGKMDFKNILVLNTHGGNSQVIIYTLREIQTTLGLRAGIFKPTCETDMTAQEKAFGFHAGQWETSLMLACAPELVRMDKAVCEYPTLLETTGAAFAWMTRDLSKSGVMGDARTATLEKGKLWLEKASTGLAERIVELLA